MTDSKRWGAYPAEWEALVGLGLTDDLFPYVAAPNIEPALGADGKVVKWTPASKMPSAINKLGMGHGITGWREKVSTPADIARWKTDDRLGVCIVCRTVKAIDVDIEVPEVCDGIEAILVKHFGLMPTRRRANSSRFVVLVRLVGGRGRQTVVTKHGNIDVLGDGQQVFLCGTHKSGERFQWDGGLPDFLPEVTEAEFAAALAEVTATYGTELVSEFGSGKGLLKSRMAVDINDDVVQHLQETGWATSVDQYGKVYIRCPWEHTHTSGGDGTSTAYFPAGVGGYERGHFDCKHTHCRERNDGDFLEAVGYVSAQFEMVEVPEGEIEVPAFERNLETGKILSTINNVVLALRSPAWLGVHIANDLFRDDLMLTPYGKRAWRSFKDSDYTRLRMVLNAKGVPASLELMKEAVLFYGDESTFDSAILWLEKEVPAWDGVPRIDSYFPSYYGCEDTPYTRSVGTYTWTALAARVLDPGHKVDMVPILSSGEGCRKSESIAAMVPDRDFFVELDLGAKDDDMSRLMRGRLVAELGEMRGLRQREMGALKSFITRTVENWIPKYRERATKFPRRLLFIGTTNETEFLSEQTGHRRWLPIAITRADTAAIERDRLQLWAEGRERFRADGLAFEDAEVLARDEHQKFEEAHPWEELVMAWLDEDEGFEPSAPNRDKLFTTQDVLTGAMKMPGHAVNKYHKNQVGAILRKLGFYISEGPKRTRVWRHKS